MNFATLQGLTIPEGVVTQITDASGRVMWSAVKSVPVVLQVEKITSDTYAGETTYTGEQFILLDIYPKTNGTVKVTYGGLTKTITDTSGAAEPNAQQVFFGTFNGVSDSVETPASGELTIEGAYRGFGCGTYHTFTSKTDAVYCSCITSVSDCGNVEYIPAYAFYNCKKIVSCEMPDSVLSIGQYAFCECVKLASIKLSNSITSIPDYAFNNCNSLKTFTIPANVTEIGRNAYVNANNMTTNPGTVVMLPTSPPSVVVDTGNSIYSFSAPKGYVVFTVSKGCGNAYKTATGWSAYANYITEAS